MLADVVVHHTTPLCQACSLPLPLYLLQIGMHAYGVMDMSVVSLVQSLDMRVLLKDGELTESDVVDFNFDSRYCPL